MGTNNQEPLGAAASVLGGFPSEEELAPVVEEEAPAPVIAAPSKDADVLTAALSNPALAALITTIVQAAVQTTQQSKSNELTNVAKILADAIVEAKKPYVDPRQLENEKQMRDQMRKQREKLDADIRASQEICPHLQGSNALSEFAGQMTSIVQHMLDDGSVVGVCTNCMRVFRPGDPDYLTQMRRKSGNKISSSGQRFFLGNRK